MVLGRSRAGRIYCPPFRYGWAVLTVRTAIIVLPTAWTSGYTTGRSCLYPDSPGTLRYGVYTE